MVNDKELTLQELLGSILTSNVNMSEKDYKKMLKQVTKTYDANNNEKGKRVSLEEKRQRIASNFYGSTINMLFQILNVVSDLYNNWTPIIQAVAEKVGVDFENAKSAEEKAMEAVAEFYKTRAKQAQNKE